MKIFNQIIKRKFENLLHCSIIVRCLGSQKSCFTCSISFYILRKRLILILPTRPLLIVWRTRRREAEGRFGVTARARTGCNLIPAPSCICYNSNCAGLESYNSSQVINPTKYQHELLQFTLLILNHCVIIIKCIRYSFKISSLSP